MRSITTPHHGVNSLSIGQENARIETIAVELTICLWQNDRNSFMFSSQKKILGYLLARTGFWYCFWPCSRIFIDYELQNVHLYGFGHHEVSNSGQNTLRHILRKHAVQGKPRIMVQGKQLNQVVVTLCLSPCIIKNQGSWDADHPSSSSQKHAIGKLVGETCSIITYIITRWYNANNTRLVRFNWSTCFPSTPQECLCKKKSFLLAKTEYCSKRKCLTKCRPADSPLHEPWEMQFLWTVSLHYDYWYFLIAYRLIDLGQSLV
jgi:hypothetical protein